MPQLVQKGRLAFRHEGNLWNAYWALPDSMAGAVLLGSINFNLLNDRVKTAFMAAIKLAVSDLFQDEWGVRPEWPNPPRPAPESERGGNA